ncbi:MAG TPA: hypothetical protein VER55_12335, partial [Ardenticatenaceae bacterium]|nr:hypothetical protein [Ardenticatenaceae bacterium]
MAIARMAREPLDLSFHAVPLAECPTADGSYPVVTSGGDARWADQTGAHFLLGEASSLEPPATCRTLGIIARASLAQPLLASPAQRVRGSWRLLGTAGWPLVAFGAAAALASDLVTGR